MTRGELGLRGEQADCIPVSVDRCFATADGIRFGIELCEDLWTPLPPSTALCLGGAEVILNLSASNETIAKREYRRQLVSQQSARCLCGYVYVSAGETESTQDLVFSGHSMIAENGSILAENRKLLDTDYVLTMDLDLGRIPGRPNQESELCRLCKDQRRRTGYGHSVGRWAGGGAAAHLLQ